jgi:hypothetical protein
VRTATKMISAISAAASGDRNQEMTICGSSNRAGAVGQLGSSQHKLHNSLLATHPAQT